jgi:hypothetical protein
MREGHPKVNPALRAALALTVFLVASDAHADPLGDARALATSGAFAEAAAAFERVAADATLAVSQRAEAATSAAAWRAQLEDREHTIADVALVHRLQPPSWDYFPVLDRWLCDIDFRRWRRSQTNSDGAIASCLSVFNTYRRTATEDALLTQLETAWRIAQIKTAVKARDHRDWLKTTASTWAALDAAGNGRTLAFSRLWQNADHAAQAEYLLVDEDIEAAFPEPWSACRFLTYNADETRFDELDKKLQHIVSTYPSDEWVATAEARRGLVRDAQRTSLYMCGGAGMWWTTSAALNQARMQYLAMAMNVNPPPPLVTAAWATYTQAKQQRDAWIDLADQRVVQLYAHALEQAERAGVRNSILQHAARRLLNLVDLAALPHLKLLTAIDYDRTLRIAQGYAIPALRSDVLTGSPVPSSP